MRRILRCAFAGLLSLALSMSGATLGLAHIAATHAGSEGQTHHTAAHHGHHHHGHHGAAHAPAGEETQPSTHPSKNCCSACTVVSPLPPVPQTIVEPIVSLAVYSNSARFDVEQTIPIDPAIPKRMS
jgi:hypothetical protein